MAREREEVTFLPEQVLVRRITYEQVVPFANAMKKERVTLANPDGCIWLGAYLREVLIGVMAVVIRKNKARFKSDWMMPVYRGAGVYSKMCAERTSLVVSLGVKRATAFCTPMSWPKYRKDGFVERSRRGDIVYCVKNF